MMSASKSEGLLKVNSVSVLEPFPAPNRLALENSESTFVICYPTTARASVALPN